ARAPGWPPPVGEHPPWSGLAEDRGALQRFLDCALHIERLLGYGVVLALHNFAEAPDGVGQLYVFSREPGELLRDVEGLGEEFLNLARARHRQFVLIGKLVDTQNGDDVLQ